jgi:hypothetical protein
VTRAASRPFLAVIAIALGFALLWSGSASAKPLIGKDGKIHACYRVKGKPKGMVRVIKSSRARCRKGERKVAWVAAGAVGPAGGLGTQGSAGPTGSTPSVSALEAKVAGLTARLQSLEGILAGVCAQATDLTTQVNSLATALGGTVLGGVIPLGLALVTPALPSVLPDYACPS